MGLDQTTSNYTSLQDELNRVKRDLGILYEVSNAMRTTLELNHVLHIILTGVTSHTGLGFNRAVLFLINPKERCLEPKMAIGPESGEHAKKIWEYIANANQDLDDLIQEERMEQNSGQSALFQSIKNLKIPLGTQDQNVLAMAFHKGELLHLKKDQINQFAQDPLLSTFKTKELIIMPLKAKDKVNGLIIADNLYTQKEITDDDLQMCMMLANQAGLAIENSQLYEMIMQQSHTDSLTNVWNHGFFQNQLSEQLKFAKRTNESLSLLMIDIDNFKKLNDTLGHQNGDIVLKEMAGILKESSREIDFVCRYGGEEFSIILPRTNKEQGYVIAERIRQKVEKHSFDKITSKPNFKITISLGLATFPTDAQTKEELIMEADRAMYIAKFGGKNQTCVANKQ